MDHFLLLVSMALLFVALTGSPASQSKHGLQRPIDQWIDDLSVFRDGVAAATSEESRTLVALCQTVELADLQVPCVHGHTCGVNQWLCIIRKRYDMKLTYHYDLLASELMGLQASICS